jgi:hydroxymethylpyrimidine/phosphomethylpyrimidine kinase
MSAATPRLPCCAFRAPRSLTPAVLTIAGSDSGGGAGIQADLKTFAALGVFGTTAVTCMTAQNPRRVAGVQAASARMVALQIRTVCEAFPIAAAKTGMLYSAGIVGAVAQALRSCRVGALVVDPVMVATSGAVLLRSDAVVRLCRDLFPLATVVTPNVPEAEKLWGKRIRTASDMEAAARDISRRFATACLLKGGHLNNTRRGRGRGAGKGGRGEVVNVFAEDGRLTVHAFRAVAARETHGTGCTLSAALAAYLARGESLERAAWHAGRFVHDALSAPLQVGCHWPLGIPGRR